MVNDALVCSKCGGPFGDDPIWPGNSGGDICQMCFEDECSASWWAMCEAGYWAMFAVPPSMELAHMLNMAAGTEGLGE